MTNIIINPAVKPSVPPVTPHPSIPPTKDVIIDDFLGAARGVISDALPDHYYVLPMPKSFAWCSLAIHAMSGAAEIFITMSSPRSIHDGSAIWIPWDADGTDNLVTDGGSRLFRWEWPLVAIAIKSSGTFRYEIAHKII